mgnify:CR=1 FL=1
MEENREKQIPIVQSRQDDEIEIDLKEIFSLVLEVLSRLVQKMRL